MSKRLRVITHPGDIHAGAVEWALAHRDVETTWMCLSDFPAAATYSVEIREDLSAPRFADTFPDDTSDVVWIRRIGRSPCVPAGLDERDKLLCQRESERFFAGLIHVVAPDAWWVNPLPGFQRSVNNKLHQLRIAQASGFRTPDTLASNDPTHIREFFRRRRGKVISKPFFPHMWNSADGNSSEYLSSMVSPEFLGDDRVLQASPLIYQGFVEKKFELRVVVFGRALIAAKLDARGDPELSIDWRHPNKKATVEPFALSPKVRELCFRVLHSLGLVHGSFDLIVTPDDEVVFLEVNESGQCLWLEEDCPDLPVLSALVGLLLQRSPHFSEEDFSRYPYRFCDFLSSRECRDFIRRAETDHLPASREGVVFQE